MARRVLTEAEVAHAIGMLQGGVSQSDVGRHFAVHRSVIHRAWQRFQATGQYSARPRSGRPRATTRREDQYVVLSARRQRFVTARRLQTDLQTATGTRVSTQTVRNRLHQAGLQARRPAQRVPLNQRQRQTRLNWGRQHGHWRLNKWRRVVFTDESRFSLDFNDGRQQVWRQPGERFAACTVAEHDRYGGGSLMVWGGIWAGGRTDLVVFRRGALNANRYLTEVIRPHVIPQMRRLGGGYLFMDDNAPCHRAHVIRNELNNNNIARLDWPARSPDLNPIEQAWDMLGRAVYGMPAHPQTLDELEAALEGEWRAIPQNRLDRLIASMPRRINACIHACGGHTRY